MRIHQDSYRYLEVFQVQAIDQNFYKRPGTLTILPPGKECRILYMPESGESPLDKEDRALLSKIVYGWGPKTHVAAKSDVTINPSAESKPESFSKVKNCLGKPLMHLVPLNVVKAVAEVYTAEFPQYGEDWKRLPNAKEIFYDSLYRHMEAFQRGEKYDEDGKLHAVKMVCNAIFIAWHVLMEKEEENGSE